MSNVLRRLKMLLCLVAVIPKISCNFPEFHDKRGGPSFAGVSLAKPEEVSLLCPRPLNSDASFEESKPSDAVFCSDCLKKAWSVELSMREGLKAAPGDVFGGMNRLEPFAKGEHEQRPDNEDCWFLAGPNMASVFVLSTARQQSKVGCCFH